jgi:hypothetical protein
LRGWRPHLHDLALGIDEKGVAVGDGHGAVVTERAVLIHHLVLRVGEQAEGQPFLGAELLVAVGRVDADADDDRVLGLELRKVALEVMRLDRAALGHVLGIEVEHDPLALEAVEGDLRAVLRWQREARRNIAHSGHRLIVGMDCDISNRQHQRRGKNEEEGFSHGGPPVDWTGNWLGGTLEILPASTL